MHTYEKNCKRLSTSVCPVRKQTAFLHLLESACLSSLTNSEPSSNKPKWTVLTTGSRGVFRAGWHVPGQLFDATIVNICLVSWETDVQLGYPSRGINCSRLLFSRKRSINYLSALLLKVFDVPPKKSTKYGLILQGIVHPKLKFRHHLLTLTTFQASMTLFIL